MESSTWTMELKLGLCRGLCGHLPTLEPKLPPVAIAQVGLNGGLPQFRGSISGCPCNEDSSTLYLGIYIRVPLFWETTKQKST